MKLDMHTVEMLSRMPDDKLWHTMRMLTAGMGMELPERRRGKLAYEAIRRTLSEITEADLMRMNAIRERYQFHKRSCR